MWLDRQSTVSSGCLTEINFRAKMKFLNAADHSPATYCFLSAVSHSLSLANIAKKQTNKTV